MTNLYDPSMIRTSNMIPLRDTDVEFIEPTLTKQSFLEETDINNIVASNASFAPLTPEEYSKLNFADLGDGLDFQTNQNYIAQAQTAFFSLPATVRERFANNPSNLLDFVQNPANLEEAIALGIATRRPQASSEPLSASLTPQPSATDSNINPDPVV
jgi:phage internal scaffolding protein